MKSAAPILLLVTCISGCSLFTARTTDPVQEPKKELPPRPVTYVQDIAVREPYTGVLPYVICFGVDCDKPTAKHPAQRQPTPKPTVKEEKPEAIRIPVKETRIRESVQYLYNTVELDPSSKGVLKSVVDAALASKEVLIKGYAGLTDTNSDNESRVLGLALYRARDIENRIRKAGVHASISISAELARCKSEDDCLQRYKYGGRRADVEIVIIEDGDKSVKPK